MSSSRTGAEKQGFTTTIRSRASNMAMLARKIALTLATGPRQMDRALALDHGLFACSASDRVWTLMNSACGSMISWTSLGGGVSCRARPHARTGHITPMGPIFSASANFFCSSLNEA